MRLCPTFPSADEIAQLVVATANLTGEDPIAMVASRTNTRGRAYAFHVLCVRYRFISQNRIARVLGTDGSDAQTSFLRTAPRARWWNQLIIDELSCSDAIRTARVAFAPYRDRKRVSVTAALMGDPDPARVVPHVEHVAIARQPRLLQESVEKARDLPPRVRRPTLPPRFYAGAQPRAGR